MNGLIERSVLVNTLPNAIVNSSPNIPPWDGMENGFGEPFAGIKQPFLVIMT
jgi:hypothetical protein